MKKRLFVGVVAGVLATSMCVSLAACGSEVDAKGVKGETVTEEEWEAAIELLMDADSDYTVEYLSEESSEGKMTVLGETVKGGMKETNRATYVKNGNIVYVSGYRELKYSGDGAAMMGGFASDGPAGYASESVSDYYKEGKTEFEMYSEINYETGASVNYTKDEEGNWTKSNGYVYNSALGAVYSLIMDLGDYEDYEYSEEYKGYIEKDFDGEEGETPTVYKFQDKKLVAVYQHSEVEGEEDDGGLGLMSSSYEEESTLNVTCKYEAKELTLPEVAE